MKQSGFQFTNPIISKINYEFHPNFIWDKEKGLSIANAFKTQIGRNQTENSAYVELTILLGNTDQQKSPFYIEMIIGASFKWDNAYTEKTINDLLSINAPALLLSYARPMVATITNMSPYPSYRIPFYNFTE